MCVFQYACTCWDVMTAGATASKHVPESECAFWYVVTWWRGGSCRIVDGGLGCGASVAQMAFYGTGFLCSTGPEKQRIPAGLGREPFATCSTQLLVNPGCSLVKAGRRWCVLVVCAAGLPVPWTCAASPAVWSQVGGQNNIWANLWATRPLAPTHLCHAHPPGAMLLWLAPSFGHFRRRAPCACPALALHMTLGPGGGGMLQVTGCLQLRHPGNVTARDACTDTRSGQGGLWTHLCAAFTA